MDKRTKLELDLNTAISNIVRSVNNDTSIQDGIIRLCNAIKCARDSDHIYSFPVHVIDISTLGPVSTNPDPMAEEEEPNLQLQLDTMRSEFEFVVAERDALIESAKDQCPTYHGGTAKHWFGVFVKHADKGRVRDNELHEQLKTMTKERNESEASARTARINYAAASGERCFLQKQLDLMKADRDKQIDSLHGEALLALDKGRKLDSMTKERDNAWSIRNLALDGYEKLSEKSDKQATLIEALKERAKDDMRGPDLAVAIFNVRTAQEALDKVTAGK
ncbi:hypothetical protein KAR91_84730 [Candidatus Pacearchaeota archaeon]|nr:hypothetical protein [Candidatus Pacearchaeota archaeon]